MIEKKLAIRPSSPTTLTNVLTAVEPPYAASRASTSGVPESWMAAAPAAPGATTARRAARARSARRRGGGGRRVAGGREGSRAGGAGSGHHDEGREGQQREHRGDDALRHRAC